MKDDEKQENCTAWVKPGKAKLKNFLKHQELQGGRCQEGTFSHGNDSNRELKR